MTFQTHPDQKPLPFSREDDLGVLLTEIAAHKGCSLFSFEQTASHTRPDDGPEQPSGDIGLTEGDEFERIPSLKVGETASKAEHAGKYLSHIFLGLDAERVASELECTELEAKLEGLKGSVEKLEKLLGELVSTAGAKVGSG